MTAINKQRADFYEFLSRLFEKEISESFFGMLRGMKVPSSTGNSLIDKGYSEIKDFCGTPLTNPVEELAVEYARDILGAGESTSKAAYPYESVYTSREGLVMQQAWTEVCAIYAAKGLKLQTAMADLKEDHIAIELKYMSYLCGNASYAEQKNFLKDHLINWVPKFAERLRGYAKQKFYIGAADLLEGFINADAEYLEAAGDGADAKEAFAKKAAAAVAGGRSYELSPADMDAFIAELKKTCKVYAPRKVRDKVRYGEISSVNEIITARPSDFSAKEIYYPVMQTMIYFTDTECHESQLTDDRDLVIFMHPCDINAMRRLDTVFLKNGGNADTYYERLRNKVKVIMLQCKGSYDKCFCASMKSNIAADYELAVDIDADKVSLQVKEGSLAAAFTSALAGLKSASASAYLPKFVTENKVKVELPVMDGIDDLKLASNLEYWKKFDDKCIGCGGCNTVCPTCSCFDTRDILYNETSVDGERRRVWSSCMLDTFTQTAGGARARKTAGANMRFKTLHKTYDYRTRFGLDENMCVGCGRCVMQCPKEIDFSDTINGFTAALDAARKEAK